MRQERRQLGGGPAIRIQVLVRYSIVSSKFGKPIQKLECDRTQRLKVNAALLGMLDLKFIQ
jgi:hypothetical protein